MNTRPAPLIFLAAMITSASGCQAAPAGSAQQPFSFLGGPAPAQVAPDEVIVITDNTRYVNVTGGKTVRFIVGTHAFTWTFETGLERIQPFDLRRIAPRNLLNRPVTAYVADDPLYQS